MFKLPLSYLNEAISATIISLTSEPDNEQQQTKITTIIDNCLQTRLKARKFLKHELNTVIDRVTVQNSSPRPRPKFDPKSAGVSHNLIYSKMYIIILEN